MPGTTRTIVGLFVIALFSALPAHAQEVAVGFTPEGIIFPVVGEVTYTDDFGDPRGDHTHEGNDLISVGAIKGLPVLAAGDGVVSWIGDECCYLAIDHGDGWETWYIHLDNDTPGTDDGLGWGIAVEEGQTVTQGQVIGYLGDSGNAETVSPHLHFEIRQGGVAIDPYPYLLAAPLLAEAATPAWTGLFWDDDLSVHAANIDKIAAAGLTYGCNPPDNDMYCPERQITRGEMAAFIRRTLDLPAAEQDFYADDLGDTFEEDINAVTAAGIGFGCTETAYCSSAPLLREEMAEMLVRSFGYQNPDGVDLFTDDEASRFEESINALASAGVTLGCNPPDNDRFCPDRDLTRAEMASFFVRALGL